MKRDQILQLLQSYKEIHPSEQATVSKFNQFITQNKQCFERSLLIGHITGSCWLLDLSRERVLLTHHKKLGKWIQLGGHADGDPDILNVALKEAKEESGNNHIISLQNQIFDIDVHEIPPYKQVPTHYHWDIRFLLGMNSTDQIQMSSESNDLAWFTYKQLTQHNFEASMQRMTAKWQEWLQK